MEIDGFSKEIVDHLFEMANDQESKTHLGEKELQFSDEEKSKVEHANNTAD